MEFSDPAFSKRQAKEKAAPEFIQVPLFFDEKKLWETPEKFDAYTAVIGSGPAYIFYLIEAMVDAAAEIGMDRTVSSSMGKKFFNGSSLLAIWPKSTSPYSRTYQLRQQGQLSSALPISTAQHSAET